MCHNTSLSWLFHRELDDDGKSVSHLNTALAVSGRRNWRSDDWPVAVGTQNTPPKYHLGGLLGGSPCELGLAWEDIGPWRLVGKGAPGKKLFGRRCGSVASWFMQWTPSTWPSCLQVCRRRSQLWLAAGLWASQLQSALVVPPQPAAWQSFGTSSWQNSMDQPSAPTAELCASEWFSEWRAWPERCLSCCPGMKVISINCLLA